MSSGEVHRVADRVLSGIVGGKYPAGLRLPAETELAAELGCGRSTVREALRHLAGLGVVRSRRGSGALVLDFRREGTPALLPQYLLAGRFDRPPAVLAYELLRVRSMLAREAVRLAARYGDAASLGEARRILAKAPSLESDPAAHALNELDFFRALVFASGIWPAAWLANAFFQPLREIYGTFAPSVGSVAPDWQAQMSALLELCATRNERAADRHLADWLAAVDTRLLADLARVLGPIGEGASAALAPAGDGGARRPRRRTRGVTPESGVLG
jgi:GntR family transcriptional regulator, transcriptional repressor for pyruvate dehydrogenase complex